MESEKKGLKELMFMLFVFHNKANKEGILAMADYTQLSLLGTEEVAKFIALAPLCFGRDTAAMKRFVKGIIIDAGIYIFMGMGLHENSGVTALSQRLKWYAIASHAKLLASRKQKPRLDAKYVACMMLMLVMSGIDPDIANRALDRFIVFSDATKVEAELIRLYARCIREGRDPEAVMDEINSTLELELDFAEILQKEVHIEASFNHHCYGAHRS
jgi:hypothetical protein